MHKKILFIPIFLILSSFLFSNDNGLLSSIRYYNKTIYYPNKSIPIKLFIQNDSITPQTFDIADQRSFNVDFIVESLKKERLPHREKFIIARNTNQPVFLREVRLEPGDEYNFIVDLAQYIVIDEPGLYRVTALFNYDLKSRNTFLTSNTLILSVRDGDSQTTEEIKFDEITTEVLKTANLPPDQVVEYTINARQKSQWNKFFLYLDLKSLFLNNEDSQRRYDRGTQEERLSMIEDFKQRLLLEDEENQIINIPYSYEIAQTSYTPTTSTVIVYKKFKFPSYMESKKYIYHLEKRDLVWYIVNYDVINLGTE